HDQPTVNDLTEIPGGEPSVDERNRPVAIATHQHRASNVDLAGRVHADLDAVERVTVVHDTAPCLGHAIGRDDVRRKVVGGTRAAEHDPAKERRVDTSQRSWHQGDQRRAVTCRTLDSVCVETVVHDQRRLCHQRSSHHRQPSDV
ncbi:MAG: hypothetical protein QOJ66_118, partial [Ilumatobacteraceae bacterium]